MGEQSGRERATAEFAVEENVEVAERAEMAQFVVVDGHGQDVLGEYHNFHHGEGIEAEILDKAEIAGGSGAVGGGREFLAEGTFDEAFDDAGDDGGEVGGVAGGAEGECGFEGGRGATFERLAEAGLIERSESGGRGVGGRGGHGGKGVVEECDKRGAQTRQWADRFGAKTFEPLQGASRNGRGERKGRRGGRNWK